MMRKFVAMAVVATAIGSTAFAQQKETIDLSPIEMAATMQVPKGVKAVEETYSYYIKGADKFEISVETTKMTLEEWKDKTKKDQMSDFVKFLETSDKGYMYECKLMGNTLVHFEYIVTIGNKTYRLYDRRVPFVKPADVKAMYEAAKTIKAK